MKSWAVYDALLLTRMLGTDFKASKTAHFHFFTSRYLFLSLNFRRKQNG
jgi:hypothetical protein